MVFVQALGVKLMHAKASKAPIFCSDAKLAFVPSRARLADCAYLKLRKSHATQQRRGNSTELLLYMQLHCGEA
eukprot:4986239-Amphidinium_carterae.2